MAECRFYQGETFANYDPGELLENAEFEDCVFDHCRWLGTRVQNCRFNACTFDHCNFSGVVFSFTTMKDAWLLNSAFRSMAWGGLQGKSGVFQPFGKIKNCAFRYNDFSDMALNGFDWTGAELQQCTFDDTRLAEVHRSAPGFSQHIHRLAGEAWLPAPPKEFLKFVLQLP